MILYKKKNVPVLRYLIAILIFTLGLMLTVVDVYGLQLPFGQNHGDSYNEFLKKKTNTTDDSARASDEVDIIIDTGDEQQGTDTIPTSVPEPSTLILLASGLGLFGMAHRKKS